MSTSTSTSTSTSPSRTTQDAAEALLCGIRDLFVKCAGSLQDLVAEKARLTHIVEAITEDTGERRSAEGQQKVQELQADIEKLELQEMLYDDLQARCCCTVVTLLLRCCYTVLKLLLHCCHAVVTLLLHCCHNGVKLLSHCCHTRLPPPLRPLRPARTRR
jgi:hypothetical protein